MELKIGQIWKGTTLYIEDKLIDVHEVEIMDISDDIIKYRRLDNDKENVDITYSFVENFSFVRVVGEFEF